MAFVLCNGHHLFILLRPPCCASSQQHTLAKLWGLGSHDLLAHRLTSQTFKQERCLTCSLKKTQQANKGSSGPEVSMSGSPCVFSLLCCLYKIHTLSFSLCQSETAMAEKQLLAAQRDDKERLLLLPPLPRLCALVSGEKTFSISDVKYSTIYLFWVAVCFSFLVFFFLLMQTTRCCPRPSEISGHSVTAVVFLHFPFASLRPGLFASGGYFPAPARGEGGDAALPELREESRQTAMGGRRGKSRTETGLPARL